jgi:hypothetical protein
MQWAKAPMAIGSVACAACLAVAGTMTSSIPAAQQAAERMERAAQLRLAAITDVDAFSGIPAILDLLGGNIDTLLADDSNAGWDVLSAVDVFFGDGANGDGGVFTGGGVDALAGYDALSAIPVFVGTDGVFTGGGVDALSGYDALSAIPVFVGTDGVLTGGGVSALQNYAALSAANTFFGEGSLNQDGTTHTGGVFTGGGINALAPGSDGNGGYAALSALPVFAGTDDNAPFGLGVFTGGGVGALKNYDALSAIPAYLNATQGTSTTPPTPFIAAAPQTQAGPEVQTNLKTQVTNPQDQGQDQQTPVTDNKPKFQKLAAVAPVVNPAPSAPPADDPAPADPPANNSGAKDSKKTSGSYSGSFKPGTKAPLIFGFGGNGSAADNGIRGWGDMLKKAGLNGGDAGSSSAGAGGAGAGGGGGAGGGE